MTANNPNMQPLSHHDEDDDSIEGTIARMKELFAAQETAVEKLHELYAGSSADFHAFADDLTYIALEDNHEFIENAKKMRTANHEQALEIRNKQRALFDEAKQALLLEAGLPLEASLDERTKTQEKIASILRAKLDESHEVAINDVLFALGILEEDENGRERFTYPEALFPESTNTRWETYEQSVLEYFRIERAVKLGTRGRKDLETIDGSRRIAHNAIAHDLDDLLGLSELPDTKWDFEKTRRLVTKMRDKKYPTIETAERASTNDAIGSGLMGLQALKALNVKVITLQKK